MYPLSDVTITYTNPLHLAAQQGDVDKVKQLLTEDADPLTENGVMEFYGITTKVNIRVTPFAALLFAKDNSPEARLAITELLLSREPALTLDRFMGGFDYTAKELLGQYPEEKKLLECIEAVSTVFRQEVTDRGELDRILEGKTPFDAERFSALVESVGIGDYHFNSKYGDPSIVTAIEDGLVEVVEALLTLYKEKNIDINTVDSDGWPLLLIALYEERSAPTKPMLNALFEHGADPEYKNTKGKSTFDYIADYIEEECLDSDPFTIELKAERDAYLAAKGKKE